MLSTLLSRCPIAEPKEPVTTAEHRRQRELHLKNKRAKSEEKKAALLLMGLTESTNQDPDDSASSQVSEVPVLN
ncbi:TPA: hypothetical protein ACH3X1_002024 [Trebouxia sp. C0004]